MVNWTGWGKSSGKGSHLPLPPHTPFPDTSWFLHDPHQSRSIKSIIPGWHTHTSCPPHWFLLFPIMPRPALACLGHFSAFTGTTFLLLPPCIYCCCFPLPCLYSCPTPAGSGSCLDSHACTQPHLVDCCCMDTLLLPLPSLGWTGFFLLPACLCLPSPCHPMPTPTLPPNSNPVPIPHLPSLYLDLHYLPPPSHCGPSTGLGSGTPVNMPLPYYPTLCALVLPATPCAGLWRPYPNLPYPTSLAYHLDSSHACPLPITTMPGLLPPVGHLVLQDHPHIACLWDPAFPCCLPYLPSSPPCA